MDILDLLASDNYIPYNRTLAKQIGLENAIIFGALCGYQRHYKQQEFFREQQNIMDDTCLTEYAVRKAIKELKELNLINVVKKGLPAKYYYKINTTTLIQMLSTSGNENGTTGDIEKTSTNNKINNKIDNNDNKSKKVTFDEIINSFTEDEEIRELLSEWLKVRKAKRAAMTNRAIELNLQKLNKLANDSKMSVADYLKEVICRGWQAFYVINNYNKPKEKSMWEKMNEVFDE